MDPAVRVMHQPVKRTLPRPERLLEGVEGEVGAERAGDLPADDRPRVDIGDEGHVHEARPRADVGEVGDPEPVRRRRVEVTLHEVGRPRRCLVSDRRALRLPTHRADQPDLLHQPFDGAACCRDAFAVELTPELARAVHAEVLGMDLPEFQRQCFIAYLAR